MSIEEVSEATALTTQQISVNFIIEF